MSTKILHAAPAGDYEIAAWHEVYGELAAQKVTLKDGESRSIEFVSTK